MAKAPKTAAQVADDNILDNVAQASGDGSIASNNTEDDNEPMYRAYADSKIPVSKSRGKLWKSRRDQAAAKLKKTGDMENWDTCIAYYKNDQMKINDHRLGKRGDDNKGDRLTSKGRSTENIVFANVTALVPATYAKNPDCEVTPENQDDEQLVAWCKTAQKLVNALASGKTAPCFNLKPKMRKAVVMTTLTNLCYLEVGYVRKEESSDKALADLQVLSTQLQEAKSITELRDIEGRIEALEGTIDVLRPSGPFVNFVRPHDVLKDTDAVEDDLSDSRWVMVRKYVSTALIKAKFAKPDEDGNYASIYDPTHVIGITDSNAVQDEIDNFTLLGDTTTSNSMGYEDDTTFQNAQRTCVWYVWDRVTQRVEMYHDKNWTWPIWVWDDPYHIDTFFPLIPMQFYISPDQTTARGEVSYYLDQQDEINDMNDMIAKARSWARGNIFYNKNVIKDASMIDKFLEGGSEARAVPVDVPAEAGDLKQFIWSMVPPAMEHKELFNKDNILQSIDRVSSVSSVMRGTEYKTNTTNKAIESYTSQDQTRLDEKTDVIEDVIGEIQWMMIQMCAQFMSEKEVSAVIGADVAGSWKPMTPQDIMSMVDVKVAGGSSQKPTSSAKKKEAMQMLQVLGQFAKAGGGAAIIIALKSLERAFSDTMTITDTDWKMLEDAIKAELTRGQSAGGQPPGAPGQAPAPGGQAGGPPQSSGGSGEGPAPLSQEQVGEAIKVVAKLINEMPPQMKQALGNALGKGMPIEEALPRIMAAMSGAGDASNATRPN